MNENDVIFRFYYFTKMFLKMALSFGGSSRLGGMLIQLELLLKERELAPFVTEIKKKKRRKKRKPCSA